MRPHGILLPGVALAASLCLLAACGKKEEVAEQPAGRVAAKVNGEVIVFDQVQDVDGLSGTDTVDPGALDKLVDLTILAQAARAKGLDKDPVIARRLEAAARGILARAYLDQAAEASFQPPSAVEARKYYDEHPELFAQRRTYQMRELKLSWPAEGGEALRKSIEAARSPGDVDKLLASKGLKFAERALLEPAERLPLNAVKAISKLPAGGSIVLVDAEAGPAQPGRARVLTLVSAKPSPKSVEDSLPAIQAFLHNERRRAAGREHVAQLRAGAQVLKYAGDPLIEPVHARKPATP